MRGHDWRIFDDESKQIFIQFELSRGKHIQNTLKKDLLKVAINKSKKLDKAISAYNYQPGTDLYSMITDKITVVVITHLPKAGKNVGMTWQSYYMFSLPTFYRNKW